MKEENMIRRNGLSKKQRAWGVLLVFLFVHPMVFAKTTKNTSTPLTVSKTTNLNEQKSLKRQSSKKTLALSGSGQSISIEETHTVVAQLRRLDRAESGRHG